MSLFSPVSFYWLSLSLPRRPTSIRMHCRFRMRRNSGRFWDQAQFILFRENDWSWWPRNWGNLFVSIRSQIVCRLCINYSIVKLLKILFMVWKISYIGIPWLYIEEFCNLWSSTFILLKNLVIFDLVVFITRKRSWCATVSLPDVEYK